MYICQNWVSKLSRTCASTCIYQLRAGHFLVQHNIRHSRKLLSYKTGSRLDTSWGASVFTRQVDRRSEFVCRRFTTVKSSSGKLNKMELQNIRQDARDIFDAAVKSVYPPQMIRNALTVSQDGNTLHIDGKEYDLRNNVYVVGFGKAVSGMARALDDLIGCHIVQGIISIPYGSQKVFTSIGKQDLCVKEGSKIKVFEGAENNMPDENAHTAAMAIEELVRSLGADDLLIVLISGGGSALLPSPIPPLTLQDELEMTGIVSRSGGSIQDLNVLRQNLESLKGGGLAQKAKPASVISLILSDVIEDKLDIISSGPTTPLLSSPRQCLQILERLKIKDKVPAVVRDTLQEKASQGRSLEDRSPYQHNVQSFESQWEHVKNLIIGSNSIATQAAFQGAVEKGYAPIILTNTLQGEAQVTAAMFSELAKYAILSFGDIPPHQGKVTLCETEVGLTKRGVSKMDLKRIEEAADKAYNSRTGLCIICGGETIVNVKGMGRGGRNQEMALAFAIEFAKTVQDDRSGVLKTFHVEFLSGGTDGQDGPTDAAGAVVNKNLIPTAISGKLNPKDYLNNNDSYTLFKSIKENNCLINCGLTGTNVMDIQIMIVKSLL
ncbi:glycerate kinase-like [Mercenaria mercenaria]|uniref:glycerate kinase-like n=1 Tax=Mercenaria mercenaria TaxID=6596 RepID=UPI00234EFD55|nr:glycerate kinase-like [Mercenaria mercenaria]XP_053378064.1 glycerate kinase-like [Mercenaria mercenaria]